MAPTSGKSDVLDTDISFDMERLFDEYNYDHIPVEKRLHLFKQRNLPYVKHYKTGVKIFGGPSSRTRVHVAPPMETPFKHRLGMYINVYKPHIAPILNGPIRPPPEPVELQTKEYIAQQEEEKHTSYYYSLVAERKKLRKDLDNLTLNEAYIARKKDTSELEKRVQAKYRASRLWKPEIIPLPDVEPSPKPIPSVPTMVVPPPDGLKILDKFLSLNNIRLIDLFITADKNKNWSLSRQKFFNAVTQAEIPLSKSEVDAMILALDTNFDDELTYKNLNEGLQLWRKERRIVKKQSEEPKKKCSTDNCRSKIDDPSIKLTSNHEERDSWSTAMEMSENIRPSSNEKINELYDSRSETKELYTGTKYVLPGIKQQGQKVVTLPFHEESAEEAMVVKRAAMPSPLLIDKNDVNKSQSVPIYSGQITGTNKEIDLSLKHDIFYESSDLKLAEKYSIDHGFRVSEKTLQDYDNVKPVTPKLQTPAITLPHLIPHQILNTSEIMPFDSHDDSYLYDDIVLQSEQTAPSIAMDQNSEAEEDLIIPQVTSTNESRPWSHKAGTHSHTSTPSSLEPPESNLRKEAQMPASVEELLDVRKHDRVVLSRNRIRRRLTQEKRLAFDELPGVIKVGYKPIDDHCSESTLGGDNANVVNQFRRWKLKEYYDVKRMFEQSGLMFTQKILDQVLLYPGDKPTSELRKSIAMPVGPLTDEQSPFTKFEESKHSTKWHKDNGELTHLKRKSGITSGTGQARTTSTGGASNGIGLLKKTAQQSGHRNKGKRLNHHHLGVEDVYPFASDVTPKVYNENLSSGRALISHKVDNWMTFEEYSKYTQNLPHRFRRYNKRSNPEAVWPGYLLNKLRLYMDSDLTLVDGRGRQLENRDSLDYEGYGTGMYNGRGNALFQHIGQPKRAYPGYNNDLLTWPVGETGVRYGNIDEHRLVK